MATERRTENMKGWMKPYRGVDKRAVHEKAPDWKGMVVIDGRELGLSAWVNVWPEGQKMRIHVEPLDQKPSRVPVSRPDTTKAGSVDPSKDEVPF